MTLMCIERTLSQTHKGNLLQGRKSSLSHQQNGRKSSTSPPLTKSASHQPEQPSAKPLNLKLERSVSEPAPERKLAQNTNSSRYKTELCRPFEENGTCKYGDKCQFAHGSNDLRNMARHPKYKTELCRTFHSTGLCPYGPRCHFIHNQKEKSALPSMAYGTIGRPEPLSSLVSEALTTLGSDGELSPTSSSSSPTESCDDAFAMELMSPDNACNNVFFAADFQPRLYGLGSEPLPDNYSNQGPVLDLYPTGPASTCNSNTHFDNFLRFTVFDAFQQRIH